MASDSKMDKSTSTAFEHLSNSFKHRLGVLGCPYTDDLDEMCVAEILYQPGQARLRILQWLLGKYSSEIGRLIDPVHTRHLDNETIVKRILAISSTLGFCHSNDIELVRGAAVPSKQANYWDSLLNIIVTSQNAAEGLNQEPGIVSSGMSLEEQYHRDCYYMDLVAPMVPSQDLFPRTSDVLPKNRQLKVEKAWKEQGYSKKEIPAVPKFEELIKEAKQLQENYEKQREVLEEIRKQFFYPKRDDQAKEKVIKQLKVVSSELEQVMAAFSYRFEADVRQWCTHVRPEFGQLGPSLKRVHGKLSDFKQVHNNVATIRTKYDQINQRISQAKDFCDPEGDILASAIDEITLSYNEVITTLEDTLHRERLVSL